MATEKKSRRGVNRNRVTALCEISQEDETRRAFGVYNLNQCMKDKPQPGKSYHIITGGNVDMIAHVSWLQQHWPRIKRLFISSWSIGGADILLLEKWAEQGMIQNVEILVGDVFPKKFVKEWEKLTELADRGIVKALYHSNIHSKLLLVDTEEGDKIVIEGSANCNMNPRIEQSCVTISEKLFDFYWVYLHELFEQEQSRHTVRDVLKMEKDDEAAEINNTDWPTLFGQDGIC